MAAQSQKIMEVVGKETFLDNIREFFRVVEEAWGIRRISYREGAVYMKATFLTTLADLFTRHFDFWRDGDQRLFVEAPLMRKLAAFPVSDPQVVAVSANGGGRNNQILYLLLLNHVNSGKRSKRLKGRYAVEDLPSSDDSGE